MEPVNFRSRRCPACRREVEPEARLCPHCGKPLPSAELLRAMMGLTREGKLSYVELPFYRKRWFWGLCFAVLTPVAAVLALTGPLYRARGGQAVEVSRWTYRGVLALGAITFVWWIASWLGPPGMNGSLLTHAFCLFMSRSQCRELTGLAHAVVGGGTP